MARFTQVSALEAAGPPGAYLIGPVRTFEDFRPNDEDREWVARELGDVEPRYSADLVARASLAGLSVESLLPVEDFGWPKDDLETHWTPNDLPNLIPDYFGETVPVESLGRDHE